MPYIIFMILSYILNLILILFFCLKPYTNSREFDYPKQQNFEFLKLQDFYSLYFENSYLQKFENSLTQQNSKPVLRKLRDHENYIYFY